MTKLTIELRDEIMCELRDAVALQEHTYVWLRLLDLRERVSMLDVDARTLRPAPMHWELVHTAARGAGWAPARNSDETDRIVHFFRGPEHFVVVFDRYDYVHYTHFAPRDLLNGQLAARDRKVDPR